MTIQPIIYNWICDKPNELVLKSVVDSDLTPDCPQCHGTMEAWPYEMNIEVINDIIMPLAQTEMQNGNRPFYWYNITQTVVFNKDGRIDVTDHEDLPV